VRSLACLGVSLALAASPASAQPAAPSAAASIGVDERIGARIPLELTFTDATGRRVMLGELFGDRPVLLVLTYVRCRLLCSLVLQGAVEAVRALPLELGRDYRVIMVSIDPHEDAASAAARRNDVLERLGRADADWAYLVGAERPIRTLAESLGFSYAWDPRTEQYAHPAVVFVLTPDGTIARYVHGVEYEPVELAASLRRARRGEISPGIAEAVLSCFRFDPALRAHRDRIERYLRVGATGVILALGSTVGLLVLWDRRRRHR
jgi:protein SCO1